ncbi:MAG: glycosyltransferase, partial [bacterium]
LVSIFDVGVLTSYGEGTSNSLLEYMLLEKPVVATDVLGIQEVVQNGINGFLVPQNDVNNFVKRVAHLLDSPSEAQKMGQAGKDLVAREYSIEGMVSGYESIYQSVIQKHR